MTVSTSTAKSGPYSGSGTTGPFTVTFRFLDNTHLQVIRTGTGGIDTTLTLTADYSVTGAGGSSGTVTLVAPLLTGEKLTIVRNVPLTQDTDYVPGDPFPAESHETALDKLTMITQQIKERVDSSLTIPPSASGVSTQLPNPAATQLIGWNNLGTALQNFDAGSLGVAVSYAQWRTQAFSGTGAQTAFVLTNDAGSASNIDLAVDGLTLAAGVDFTYNPVNRTITILTGAPPSGVNNVVARYGEALPLGVVDLADNSVSGTKLVDGAVTTAKIGDQQVTLAKVQNIATARVLGRVTAGSGAIEELTGAQAQALLPVNQTRVDVASAATVNLTTGAATTDHINITGTTAITAFTVAAGRTVFVRFAGALTLTNNASIVTQTGANITAAVGDTCILRATAANVVEVLSYVPAVLNQQTTRSMVRVNTANGHGSTNTVIRRFTTVVTNQGADITYADSATLGASFTINTAGVYGISYTDFFSASGDMGISLNSTQLTTAIGSITAADRLCDATTSAANARAGASVTMYLPAGSVIRPHTNGAAGGGANSQFTITRIA